MYISNREFTEQFNGKQWAWNGPYAITRLIQRICNTKNTSQMTLEHCVAVKVYPPKFCYPIPYQSWRKYFENSFANETLKLVENSTAIHVWNHMFDINKAKVEPNSAYSILAKRFCPRIFEALPGFS